MRRIVCLVLCLLLMGTHTWTALGSEIHLDCSRYNNVAEDWCVLETGALNGYTPTYHTNGNVVTITNTATLIQTGQLHWPVPVLGSLGVLAMVRGLCAMGRKSQKSNV